MSQPVGEAPLFAPPEPFNRNPNDTTGDTKIPPGEMRALVTTKEVQVAGTTLPAGTLGYFIMPFTPGSSWVQVFNRGGGHRKIYLANTDFKLGKLHSEFSVEMPLLACGPQSVKKGAARSNDPLGIVIAQFWANVVQNRAVFDSLGLSSIGHIVDSGKMDDMVMAVIASFTDQTWRVLNGSEFKSNPLKGLLSLPAVGAKKNEMRDDTVRIYARLYYTGTKANPGPQFAKYAGMSTQFLQHRNMSHDNTMKSPGSGDYNLPHYRTARSIGTMGNPMQRVMVSLMELPRAGADWKALTNIAETTACCILRSFHDAISISAGKDSGQRSIHPPVAVDLQSTVLMSDIADQVMTAYKFPMMGGKGCNWALPMGQHLGDTTPWIRRDRIGNTGKGLTTFRKVVMLDKLELKRGNVLIRFHGRHSENQSTFDTRDWRFVVKISEVIETYNLAPGTPVFIVVEIDRSGFHPSPFSRLPPFGAFDNAEELPSVGVRVEWLDVAKNQWLTKYVMDHSRVCHAYTPKRGWGSRQKLPPALEKYVPQTHVLSSWRKVTLLLQALEQRQYTNPPPYLFFDIQANVKKVEFDHLNQMVKFTRPSPSRLNSPQKVSFTQNHLRITSRMLDEGSGWYGLRQGPRPEPKWFVSGTDHKVGTGLTNTRCVHCKREYGLDKSDKRSCEQRKGDFPIDPNEPELEDIKTRSCPRCWGLFRSPCVWVPARFWLPNTKDDQRLSLPTSHEGATILLPRDYPIIPIPEPMTNEEYYGYVQRLQTVLNTEDGEESGGQDGDDDADDFDE